MHCRKSKQLGVSIEDDKLKIGSNFGNLYPVHVTRVYQETRDNNKEFECWSLILCALVSWYIAYVMNQVCFFGITA